MPPFTDALPFFDNTLPFFVMPCPLRYDNLPFKFAASFVMYLTFIWALAAYIWGIDE
jgi:hypothetical protein